MELETRPASRLVGASWSGAFGRVDEVRALWRDTAPRLDALQGRAGARYVCPYRVQGETFTYFIGVPVAADVPTPAGLEERGLPPRRYARFEHEGPMSGVQATYSGAFDALAKAGHALDRDAPVVEEYDPKRYSPARDGPERASNAYAILLPLA